MHTSLRMLDRNPNFSITKAPALSMSNFFFSVPPPEGLDKELRGVLTRQSGVNGGRLTKQEEVDDDDKVRSKLQRQGAIDVVDIQVPQICITSEENLSVPVDEMVRRVGVIEAYPGIHPSCCVDEHNNEEGNTRGRPVSYDEGMLRAYADENILDWKENKKTKKFVPTFRNKSTGCLVVEEEEVPRKSPSFKRRFCRGTSDQHIETGYTRTDSTGYVSRGSTESSDSLFPVSKSIINIKSPFAGRKNVQKSVNCDEEKKRIHNEMLQSIRNDDCKSFRALLKKRLVDVNIIYEQGSLIHEASYKGCTKCIKALLKGGCYVNLCDKDGWTALHAAVLANNLPVIKLLIDNTASPNLLSNDGTSPCHLGVVSGDVYIIHELIKAGGNPLVESSRDVTPFQLAINLKKGLILDYFLHMPCFLVDR